MTLNDLLQLKNGACVAVIGSGGKTAVVDELARENADAGVLIAPTTRIAVTQMTVKTARYLGRIEGEKLVSAPLSEIESASHEHGLTLMEADGARNMMLKGWAAHEPVIPDFTTHTLCVLPACALGMAADAAHVHRLRLFLELTGLSEGDIIKEDTIALIARSMMDKAVGEGALLINQADAFPEQAERIANALFGRGLRVIIGSAQQGDWREE